MSRAVVGPASATRMSRYCDTDGRRQHLTQSHPRARGGCRAPHLRGVRRRPGRPLDCDCVERRSSAGVASATGPASLRLVSVAIRAVLYRQRYRGVVVWNQTQKRIAWGLERRSLKGSTDWITIEVPELRIVSEAQWFAAHSRLEQTRQTYLRSTHGHLWGRPAGATSRSTCSPPRWTAEKRPLTDW